MTTNLPISYGRSLPKSVHYVSLQISHLIKTVFICSFLMILAISVNGQVLNANGELQEINYSGSYQEFTIPTTGNLNGNNFIEFFAKGADGGKRKVGSLVGKAGGGAKATGIFLIGTSTGDLKPGARIRFIVGEKGTNERSGRAAGAGGGGGTGIIYTEAASDADISCGTVSTNLSDAATCWVALVVGGGGGGAYGSALSVFGGKSGRDNESGGDGNGGNAGNGGSNGNGGQSTDAGSGFNRAGGGGGAKSSGTNNLNNTAGGKGQFEGGEGGNAGSANRRGGFGYGGGGSGTSAGSDTNAGGGGGGGYSGGGGGDTDVGGGGGSFVNSDAVLSEKEDGNRDGSPDNGRITYEFIVNIPGVIAKCKNLEVTLTNGSYTILPSDLENGSIVEAGEAIDQQFIGTSSSSLTFTCADIGEQLVTYTVVSTSGAFDDCISVIEVSDEDPPILTCPTNTIAAVVTQTQNYIINPNNLGISASDGCGGLVELSVLEEVLDCDNLGLTTIEIFGEDESGNTGSCFASFDVSSSDASTSITCPANVSVGLGDASNCPAIVMADQLSPIVEGSCTSEITYEIANADGEVFASGIGALGDTEFPMPTNIVTYTFGANNVPTPPSCSFTVSLQGSFFDDAPFLCQDNLTFDLTEEDNCTISLSENTIIPLYFACFESVEATFSHTDLDGQITTAGPLDGFNPGGQSFDIGVTEVTFTGFYGSLSETCSFTVTVNDVTPPIAQCKDVTITLAPNKCSASIPFSDFDDGSSDDCSGGNLEFLIPGFTDCSSGTCVDNPPLFNAFVIGAGAHTVSFVVRDESGNTTPCTQTITLIDETPPNAVCQDVTVNLSNPVLQATDIEAGSSDNCSYEGSTAPLNFNLLMPDNGNSSVGSSLTLDCSDIGQLNLTLEVTDGAGLSSNCNAVVTVVDDLAPNVTCQDLTVQLDGNGEAFILTADIGSATDACGIASESLNNYDFDCSNLSPNPGITYTATDVNGNSASCTATVTIEDNIAPIVQCKDVSINLDASGVGQLSANGIDDGSTDNCSIVSTSWTPMSFDCSDVGTVSVTQTFTDASGNSASCTQMVTVNDFIVPVAICNNFTVQLDVSGNASITVDDIDGGSTDACGLDSRSLSRTAFTCGDGAIPVTLSLTDPSGNSSHCTATVTVEDNIAPTALCKNINLPLSNIGQASITATDIDNGSNDNCSNGPIFNGLVAASVNPSNFNCSNVGPNTVLLTITDIGGNTATCTSTVTIIDDIAPNVQCQDLVVVLDENGQGTALVNDAFDTHSFDACGPLAISFASGSTLTDLTFDCSNLGDNPAAVYATDANGNTSSACNINIQVQDNTAPDPQCKNVAVYLSDPVLDAIDLDNGSSDECTPIGDLQFFMYDNTGYLGESIILDCSDIGTLSIDLLIADGNNSDLCTSIITVIDDIAPLALCQNIAVTIDADNLASGITPQQIDNGSSDACGIGQFTLSQNTFGCDDEGVNTVTLTVEDVNGNQSSCDAVVNVTIDDVFPEAWSSGDIGMVSIGNDYAYEPCGINTDQFYITGSGNNAISSTTDNVAYVYQSLCGDGSIIAKIESVAPNGYGGLMIRETTNANSKQVSIFSNLTNSLRHEARYMGGANKVVQSFFKPLPYWLKLERQGDSVFAYYSSTGSNFQYIHAVYVPMQHCVEIGLASFTYLPYAQTEAVFSNVMVSENNSGFSANKVIPQYPLTNVEGKRSWDNITKPTAYTIFPNPARKEFIVQLSSPTEKTETLELYNTLGQLVETQALSIGQKKLIWDVSALPSGTYWLKAKNQNQLDKIIVSL